MASLCLDELTRWCECYNSTQAPHLPNQIRLVWEGLVLPNVTNVGSCRDEIVNSRVIFIWSLIHGSSWSGFITVEPAYHSAVQTPLETAEIKGVGFYANSHRFVIFTFFRIMKTLDTCMISRSYSTGGKCVRDWKYLASTFAESNVLVTEKLPNRASVTPTPGI